MKLEIFFARQLRSPPIFGHQLGKWRDLVASASSCGMVKLGRWFFPTGYEPRELEDILPYAHAFLGYLQAQLEAITSWKLQTYSKRYLEKTFCFGRFLGTFHPSSPKFDCGTVLCVEAWLGLVSHGHPRNRRIWGVLSHWPKLTCPWILGENLSGPPSV